MSSDPLDAGRRREPAARAAIAHTRTEVCALHSALVDNSLVAWTSGNVSARVPGADLW